MENTIHQNDLLFSSFECFLHATERPQFPVPLHWHYYGEIIRVRSGSLKIQRGDKDIILSAGDMVFINPLVHHSLNYAGPGIPAEYIVFRLDMEQFGVLPSYSSNLQGMMLEAERRSLPMVFTARLLHEKHVDVLIDQCAQEYRIQAFGYDLRIRCLLYLILTSLIRHWIDGGFIPQKYSASIDPIYTMPSYIAHHIQDPLKVEELARYCGLSYPWFARKFRDIYGISCKEYIEKIRIRRVEHYLQFTDCDLDYIRRHTGYADCSHLVRDFRKLRNMTPGQFRQAYRQKLPGKDTFLKTIDTQDKNG